MRLRVFKDVPHLRFGSCNPKLWLMGKKICQVWPAIKSPHPSFTRGILSTWKVFVLESLANVIFISFYALLRV